MVELHPDIARHYNDGSYKPNSFPRGEYMTMKINSANYPPLEGTLSYKLSQDPRINLHKVDWDDSLKVRSSDGYEVECRTYRSSHENPPLIIFIHGGGFIAGSVKKNHYKILSYAEATGYTIIACDYRKAPEYQYPLPHDDCYYCLKYAYDNANLLKIDKDKIIVMGGSAGASLAASTCMRAAKDGLPVKKQVLLYPMLDPRSVIPKTDTELDKFIYKNADWTYNNNYTGWSCMFGEDKFKNFETSGFDTSKLEGIESWATPALFQDFSILPTTYISIGEVDIFYYESLSFHQKLLDNGVTSVLDVDKGYTHGHEEHLSYELLLELYLARVKGIVL